MSNNNGNRKRARHINWMDRINEISGKNKSLTLTFSDIGYMLLPSEIYNDVGIDTTNDDQPLTFTLDNMDQNTESKKKILYLGAYDNSMIDSFRTEMFNLYTSYLNSQQEGLVSGLFSNFNIVKLRMLVDLAKTKIMNLYSQVTNSGITLKGLEVVVNSDKVLRVYGDIYGDSTTFSKILLHKRPDEIHVFLGNYTGFGTDNIDCLILMLMSILFQDNLIFLRGPQETVTVNMDTYVQMQSGLIKDFLQLSKVSSGYSDNVNDATATIKSGILKADNEFIFGQINEHEHAFVYSAFTILTSIYDFLPIACRYNGTHYCIHGGVPVDIDDFRRSVRVSSLPFKHEEINFDVFSALVNIPYELFRDYYTKGLEEIEYDVYAYGSVDVDRFLEYLGVDLKYLIVGSRIAETNSCIRKSKNKCLVCVFSSDMVIIEYKDINKQIKTVPFSFISTNPDTLNGITDETFSCALKIQNVSMFNGVNGFGMKSPLPRQLGKPLESVQESSSVVRPSSPLHVKLSSQSTRPSSQSREQPSTLMLTKLFMTSKIDGTVLNDGITLKDGKVFKRKRKVESSQKQSLQEQSQSSQIQSQEVTQIQPQTQSQQKKTDVVLKLGANKFKQSRSYKVSKELKESKKIISNEEAFENNLFLLNIYQSIKKKMDIMKDINTQCKTSSGSTGSGMEKESIPENEIVERSINFIRDDNTILSDDDIERINKAVLAKISDMIKDDNVTMTKEVEVFHTAIVDRNSGKQYKFIKSDTIPRLVEDSDTTDVDSSGIQAILDVFNSQQKDLTKSRSTVTMSSPSKYTVMGHNTIIGNNFVKRLEEDYDYYELEGIDSSFKSLKSFKIENKTNGIDSDSAYVRRINSVLNKMIIYDDSGYDVDILYEMFKRQPDYMRYTGITTNPDYFNTTSTINNGRIEFRGNRLKGDDLPKEKSLAFFSNFMCSPNLFSTSVHDLVRSNTVMQMSDNVEGLEEKPVTPVIPVTPAAQVITVPVTPTTPVKVNRKKKGAFLTLNEAYKKKR